MDQFPNEQHLATQAGMAPGNNELAGKKSSRITNCDKYVKVLLVQFAWAVKRTKMTYLRRKQDSLLSGRVEIEHLWQ